MDERKVQLKKKEVLFLASLIGSEEFLGIENVLFSLSDEEIKKEWVKTQNSLEDKQYIEVSFDGSIVIDELINGIINTCTSTNIYINQKLSKGDNLTKEIHYYVTEYLAVKMEVDIYDQDTVNFKILCTVEDVYDEIIKDISLEDLPEFSEEARILPEKTLEAVKELISLKDSKGALDILLTNGVEQKIASEILELLTQPNVYCSLLMISTEAGNSGEVSELIFLQSNNHLWHCNLNIVDDEVLYQLKSKSYTECLVSIHALLKRIESIYVYGKEELVG